MGGAVPAGLPQARAAGALSLLIAFAGLPGTGKSTLARAIAQERGATWLRIDAIEQALRDSGALAGDVGPAGYLVAYALAAANLRLGRGVVADAVNRLTITRDAFHAVARDAGCAIVEVEVVCSDRAAHRQRVETRTSDIAGLVPPTWDAVAALQSDPWRRPRVVIDTAAGSVADALAALRARLPPA